MLYLKIAGSVTNSVDIDETPHSAASHLGLHCLLRPVCLNTHSKYGILKDKQLAPIQASNVFSCFLFFIFSSPEPSKIFSQTSRLIVMKLAKYHWGLKPIIVYSNDDT